MKQFGLKGTLKLISFHPRHRQGHVPPEQAVHVHQTFILQGYSGNVQLYSFLLSLWRDRCCVNAANNAKVLCEVGHRAGAGDKHGDAALLRIPRAQQLLLSQGICQGQKQLGSALLLTSPLDPAPLPLGLCRAPRARSGPQAKIGSAVWAAASAGTTTFPSARVTLSSDKSWEMGGHSSTGRWGA